MYHLRVYYTRRQVKSCMCSFHNELIVGFRKPFHHCSYYHYFSVFDHHFILFIISNELVLNMGVPERHCSLVSHTLLGHGNKYNNTLTIQ